MRLGCQWLNRRDVVDGSFLVRRHSGVALRDLGDEWSRLEVQDSSCGPALQLRQLPLASCDNDRECAIAHDVAAEQLKAWSGEMGCRCAAVQRHDADDAAMSILRRDWRI